jgi:hypothetical protein
MAGLLAWGSQEGGMAGLLARNRSEKETNGDHSLNKENRKRNEWGSQTLRLLAYGFCIGNKGKRSGFARTRRLVNLNKLLTVKLSVVRVRRFFLHQTQISLLTIVPCEISRLSS